MMDNNSLNDRLKKRESEADSLRKDMKSKMDQIHSLELQVDTIPILRTKIKDLERVTSSQELSKTSASLNFKLLNTSTDCANPRPSTVNIK